MRGPGKTGHLRGVRVNIIEAREAAMAGKTVISPLGTEWRQSDFETPNSLALYRVTGEWREKREPRVRWVNEYKNGFSDISFGSKKSADRCALPDRIACVKFIESLENE